MIRIVATLLVFVLIINPAWGAAAENKDSAQPNTVQATPESVGAMVVSEKITLMLQDGTYAKGKVLSASNSEIQLELNKVEPKERLKGPRVSIPTKEISVIHYKKSGSSAIPIALGIVGFLGGMLAGALATWNEDTVNAGAAWGGAAGGAVLGAVGGKKLAEKTITIIVKSAE